MSQHLVENLWLPIAMVWLPTGSPASLTLLHSELSESSNTEQKANIIALGKAKEWVDLQIINYENRHMRRFAWLTPVLLYLEAQ